MSSSHHRPARSKLVGMILEACQSYSKPNLSLFFDIADFINEKQGSAPREAAFTIVRIINRSTGGTLTSAFTLLDTLVKNCGYPFHLQISRKEFLNELVKTFPEKPPIKYTATQKAILTQILKWNETICKTSRYKKDLGFIRDMHRLLTYKGYVFPTINKDDLQVLNPSDNLKTIEEIEKEERLAQSAKLQELIRRGKPEDLKEANKLMKIMSGFQEDTKLSEFSKQKVSEDINKIKMKVEVFSEMVNNYYSGDAGTKEALDELYSDLKVARPTIAKLIDDLADDQETVQDLVQLNETINLLVQKYSLLREEKYDDANKIIVTENGQTNLIDFDDDFNSAPSSSVSPPVTASATGTSAQAAATNSDSLLDLLGDLDLNGPKQTQSGAITLGAISTSNSSNGISAFESLSSLQNLDTITQNGPLHQGSASQQLNAIEINKQLNTGSGTPISTGSSGADVTVSTSANIKISYERLADSGDEMQLLLKYSNMTLKNISNVTASLAVTKSFKLQLMPQSNNFLLNMSTNGITQVAKITRVAGGPVKDVKIKWKLTYHVQGVAQEEVGVFTV